MTIQPATETVTEGKRQRSQFFFLVTIGGITQYNTKRELVKAAKGIDQDQVLGIFKGKQLTFKVKQTMEIN